MLLHWSQFVPNMSTDIRGHEALHHHHRTLKSSGRTLGVLGAARDLCPEVVCCLAAISCSKLFQLVVFLGEKEYLLTAVFVGSIAYFSSNDTTHPALFAAKCFRKHKLYFHCANLDVCGAY